MKLLPLVIHGGLHIPRWTSIFSDTLDATSMTVVSGGLVTVNLGTPHGLALASEVAISVTDAETPNPITAATVNDDGDIVITTQFEHDLTFTPDPSRYRAWNDVVKVAGFSSALINGTRQIVAIPDRNTIVFSPAGEVASISLTGNEKMFDRPDGQLIGWHKATVAGASTLTFPTPASITRSFTVATPIVVTNIRIFAALHPDEALAQLTREDSGLTLDKAHLFVLPQPVRASRSRSSRTDSIVDFGPGNDFRMSLIDGFTLLAFLPSAGTAAHVKAIDKAQGEIFKAMLRSFNGLTLNRSELSCAAYVYAAAFQSHQGASVTNRALYAHEYNFEQQVVLTNEDAISPWQWGNIDDAALEAGTVPDTIGTVGTVPWKDLDVTGILHYGHPSPLSGNFELE